MFDSLKKKLRPESASSLSPDSSLAESAVEIPIAPPAGPPPLYDLEAVRPMWEELQQVGIEPWASPDQVDSALGRNEGTALVVINSVCGCAAGNARPGVALALQHDRIPDTLGTVFAGVDRLAVDRARAHMTDIAPSSPCIALFKNGAPAFVLERRHIEQMSVQDIAQSLQSAFDEHCTRQGPSIPKEEFDKWVNVKMCGSSIPLWNG